MTRSNASQGSRRDARNTSLREDWPRVGAKLEDGKIVVRWLEDGEGPDAPRAVLTAEPCSLARTVLEAGQRAAASLAESLRNAGATLPVEVAPSLRA